MRAGWHTLSMKAMGVQHGQELGTICTPVGSRWGFEHRAIKKQQGLERLIVRGGSHVDGQIAEELVDLGGPHLGRMANLVEANVADDPVGVGFLGAAAVVP